MKAGWTISAIGHVAVLTWGLVSFVGKPPPPRPPIEFFADVVTDAELSQMTRGVHDAKPTQVQQPLVEKVAEAKPTENPNSKVVDNKPEVVPTVDENQPKPEPEQKKPEPKKVEPKPPEQKQAFAKEEPKPEPKPDPIAEALKKDDSKKPTPEKKAETPTPPKKPDPKPQPKFVSASIKALLDKREPHRQAATGSVLNSTPSRGTATGAAVQLTQNELDALIKRLGDCWKVPVGVREAGDLVVTVRIQFKQDGSLSAEPRLMNHDARPAFQAASESALRAVRSCAPYSFLPVAKYEAWKDVIVDFDPSKMFTG